MEREKHIAIIRSRLERLLRELRGMPVLGKGEITTTYEALLVQLDGAEPETAELGSRSITLTELRVRLTGMPGAQQVIEAIDAAIADGAD
jgi:hypothetical protein